MTYARIQNNVIIEYPVYEGDIRLRYLNVSFTTNNFEPPEEYIKIEDVIPPSVNHMENLAEGTPIQTDTGWIRNWIVEGATTEEIQQRIDNQWTNIRIQRNALLQQTDWICARSVDTGESVSDEWKTYRQALRDVTLQEDPFAIVWPVEPI